jgi:hypothetical protein
MDHVLATLLDRLPDAVFVVALTWTVLGLRPLIGITLHGGTATLRGVYIATALWVFWVFIR